MGVTFVRSVSALSARALPDVRLRPFSQLCRKRDRLGTHGRKKRGGLEGKRKILDPAVFYPFTARTRPRDGILTSRKCNIQSQGKYGKREKGWSSSRTTSNPCAKLHWRYGMHPPNHRGVSFATHLFPSSTSTAKATS